MLSDYAYSQFFNAFAKKQELFTNRLITQSVSHDTCCIRRHSYCINYTPFGPWKFTRLPFRLWNAAQTFQRFMNEVVNGLDLDSEQPCSCYNLLKCSTQPLIEISLQFNLQINISDISMQTCNTFFKGKKRGRRCFLTGKRQWHSCFRTCCSQYKQISTETNNWTVAQKLV